MARRLPTRYMYARLKIPLLLAPTLTVILLFFVGGLGLALSQSLGYMPIIGRYDVNLNAYGAVFARADFYRSLWLTLWIAGVSTAVATILAIVFALTLRHAFRGKVVATFIFQLNLPIPHLVGAIAIFFLFAQSGFLSRLAYLFGIIHEPSQFPALVYDPYALGIILEYVWKTTFFIGIIVLAILHGIDGSYEDVARNLGANRWQRFRFVILPFILPGVLSSSVLVFAFTFGAFEVPLLLGQRFPSALPVLAYRAYTDVDLNARPEAMAMSVIITLVSAALIFIYMQLAKRSE